MKGTIQALSPAGMMKNPAFSQVVTTSGNGKTIYIGGQNSVNEKQELIAKGDLGAQTVQVMQNMETALASCGADFGHLVKLSIHIVQGENLFSAFQASQKWLGHLGRPPVVTVMVVAGLANPGFLIEIDAVAFLPEEN